MRGDGVGATLVLLLLIVACMAGALAIAFSSDVPLIPQSESELVHGTAQAQAFASLMAVSTATPEQTATANATAMAAALPTPTTEPTATPGPYEIGGIDFADPRRPIFISLDPGGLDITIRAFSSYPVDTAFDFGNYDFKTFRDASNTWLADGSLPVVVLHSGVYRGEGLTMWPFQSYMELNDKGNRSGPDLIEHRILRLEGQSAIVIQGNCEIEACRASLFRIETIVRVPPESVDQSQLHLETGFQDYLGLSVDNGFVIRTCGRQAAGETYVGSRNPWQQARFNIAFEYIGGPIDYTQYVAGGE